MFVFLFANILIFYNIHKLNRIWIALPPIIPTVSHARSFQHQWFPFCFTSCHSLAMAHIIDTSGHITAKTKHTPKCSALSLPVQLSLHLLIVRSSLVSCLCCQLLNILLQCRDSRFQFCVLGGISLSK